MASDRHSDVVVREVVKLVGGHLDALEWTEDQADEFWCKLHDAIDDKFCKLETTDGLSSRGTGAHA